MLASDTIYLCCDPSTTFDPYFRYKVQAPTIVSETKKGRNVTTLVDIEAFAESIHFDANLLHRLIGKMLHCNGTKNGTNCSYSGGHTKQELLRVICDVIQTYLICSRCDTPEIELRIKNKGLIQSCNACGFVHPLHVGDKHYDIILAEVKKRKHIEGLVVEATV